MMILNNQMKEIALLNHNRVVKYLKNEYCESYSDEEYVTFISTIESLRFKSLVGFIKAVEILCNYKGGSLDVNDLTSNVHFITYGSDEDKLQFLRSGIENEIY